LPDACCPRISASTQVEARTNTAGYKALASARLENVVSPAGFEPATY
jgi:hypothetical protein